MPLPSNVQEALRSGIKIPAPHGASATALCQVWWSQHGKSTPVIVPEGDVVHVFMTNGEIHSINRADAEEHAGLAASVDDQAAVLYGRFCETFPTYLPDVECAVSVLKLGETVRLSRNAVICEFSPRNPTYYDAVFVFDDGNHIHYNKKNATSKSHGTLLAEHSGDIGGQSAGQQVLLHTIKFPSGTGRGVYSVCGYQNSALHRFGPAVTIIIDRDQLVSHLLVKTNDICDVGERTICYAPMQFDVHTDHILCTPLADAQNTAGMTAVPNLSSDDIKRMTGLMRNYSYLPPESAPLSVPNTQLSDEGNACAVFADVRRDLLVAHLGKPVDLDAPLSRLCEKAHEVFVGTTMSSKPLAEHQTQIALPWLHGSFDGYQTFLLRAESPSIAPPRVIHGGEVWIMHDGAIPDAVRKLSVCQRRGVLIIVETNKDVANLGLVNLNALALCTFAAAAVARINKGTTCSYYELMGTPLPEFGHPERFSLGKPCDNFIHGLADQRPKYEISSPVETPVAISPSGELVAPEEVSIQSILAALPAAVADIGATDYGLDFQEAEAATSETVHESPVESLPAKLLKAAVCTPEQVDDLRLAVLHRCSDDKSQAERLLKFLPSKARVATGSLRHLCRCLACFAFAREPAQVEDLRKQLLEAIPACFATQKDELRKAKSKFCNLVRQHGYASSDASDELAHTFKKAEERVARAKGALAYEKEFADAILASLPGAVSSGRIAAKGATAQRRQMATKNHVDRVRDAQSNSQKAEELVDWLEEVSAYTLATTISQPALENLLQVASGTDLNALFKPHAARELMCLDILTHALPSLALVPSDERQHPLGCSAEVQCAYYSTRNRASCLVQHLPSANVELPSFLCSWAERSLKDFSAIPRIMLRNQLHGCAVKRDLDLSIPSASMSVLAVAAPLMCIDGITERRPDPGSTLQQTVRALLASALEASAAGTDPWSNWAIDVFRADGQRPNPRKNAPSCQRLFIIRALEVFVNVLTEPWADVEIALKQFRHALIRDLLYPVVQPIIGPKQAEAQAQAKEKKKGTLDSYQRGRRRMTSTCMMCADSQWAGGEQPEKTVAAYLGHRKLNWPYSGDGDEEVCSDETPQESLVAVEVHAWHDHFEDIESRRCHVAQLVAAQAGLSVMDVGRALRLAQLTIDDLMIALKTMEANWEMTNHDVEQLVLQQWQALIDERPSFQDSVL